MAETGSGEGVHKQPPPGEGAEHANYGKKFAGFLERKLDIRGKPPTPGLAADTEVHREFRASRVPNPNVPDDKGENLTVAERFTGNGTRFEVTDSIHHVLVSVDPISGVAEQRDIDPSGKLSEERSPFDGYKELQERIDALTKDPLRYRLADKIEGRAPQGVVDRLRGSHKTPRGGGIRRRVAAGAAAAAILAGGGVAISNSGENTPPPPGPGIEGPAVPGQEQENQSEAQEIAVQQAQSIIDTLRNPNLGTKADSDGQGFTNELVGYKTDGTAHVEGTTDIDGTQVGSVRLQRTEQGQNYITVSGFTHESNSGISEDTWATYGFIAPEDMDADQSGDISLDEFREAIGREGADLRFASVGVGVQSILETNESGAAVGSQEIGGDKLLMLWTPEGSVVTNRYGGSFGGGILNADPSQILNGEYRPRDDDGEFLELRPATDSTVEDLRRMGTNATTDFNKAAESPHIPGGA